MFEALGDKFESVFRKLRGEATLTETNIQEAVREVRMALLEADVNFKVTKDFTQAVTQKAIGAEVLKSLRPGQMFIKIVYEELVGMMGGGAAPFELKKGKLNRILLLGLQGSGKTTFAGKLALRNKKAGLTPLLVACDIYRPAAIEQLHVIGRSIEVPVFDMGTKTPAPKIVEAGLAEAKRRGCDLIIVDTAGRLHVDEVKMDELQAIKKALDPDYAFFVADAMTGQDVVNSAGAFDAGVGIDGVCLTKLDGDARGGAALSIRAVTGKPIYFSGIGEKSEDLEPFYPDRLAQRILGMGDVLTLVEKAQGEFDEKQAEEMQKKMRRGQFTLQDFLDHLQKVKKMGSMKSLLGMIPGLGQALKGIDIPDDAFKPFEAMIRSMTPAEREKPEILNGGRRNRIAKGSGCTPQELNEMLKEFQTTRKMMTQMMQMMGGGGMKGPPPGGDAAGGAMSKLKGPGSAGGGAGAAQLPQMPSRHGAFNQKHAHAGDPLAQKMKPKHRRKRKTKKKK